MVALFCLFLALFASPFKSKADLRQRTLRSDIADHIAAAEGARSRPAHE
jgi:hypothetical protein